MSHPNTDPSDCNSQKVDGAHARLENAFNKMMNKIDKDVIRQNYEDMFLCSANCYKDRISPIEDLHSCTERCNIKLEENKDFFQRELDSVERSIDRCERDCTELMQNLSNADSNTKSFKDLENCLSKCVDTHIDQFPSLIKRLKQGL